MRETPATGLTARNAPALRPIGILTLATLVLIALAGCHRLGFFRPAASDAFFKTKVCGVHLDGKTHEARFRIELTVTQALPRGGVVEAQFEDPANPKVPLVTTRTVSGSERTLELVSPPVTGVRARGYEFVARVYAAPDRQRVLGTHTQVCQSLLDQRELGPQFR